MKNRGNEKVGAVLVVGGGIGGIQASLDLAEQRFKVYLLEKNPSIGGHMPKLDKTFPTNGRTEGWSPGQVRGFDTRED